SDELLSINFEDIFYRRPADDRWVALVGKSAERLVELRHKYGHWVFASMSKSAMHRRDDTVALVTFRDRTEELWLNTVAPGSHDGQVYYLRQSRAVTIGGAEGQLVALGALEVQVRRIFPGHADASVQLHALLGGVHGDAAAIGLRNGRRGGRVFVAAGARV